MFCRFSSYHGGYGIGMFMMMGFWLFIIIAVIFFAYKIFKNNSGLKILDEIYAKGEINEEEYLKRKATLKNKI